MIKLYKTFQKIRKYKTISYISLSYKMVVFLPDLYIDNTHRIVHSVKEVFSHSSSDIPAPTSKSKDFSVNRL